MDFKKESIIIIYKLENGNVKARDFSPLIERVLAGVIYQKIPKSLSI